MYIRRLYLKGVKKYMEQTNDTTSNLRDANSINIILKKYEDDLREHSNEVRNLNKKIKTRDDRIEELHNENVIDDNDLDIIQNEYSKNKDKDDDFER